MNESVLVPRVPIKSLFQDLDDYNRLYSEELKKKLDFMSRNPLPSTPQVFIDGQLIGGSEELAAYLGA